MGGIAGRKLAKEMPLVRLNRLLRHKQTGGYLFVRKTLGNQLKNLQLPCRNRLHCQ
jgi:hypothetical protein